MTGERKDNVVGVLLPKSLAQEGLEFVFLGPSSACESCTLRKRCVDKLTPGRRYKVIKVFKSTGTGHNYILPSNKCQLTNEKVESVMLSADEFEVNIDSNRAISKITIRWDFTSCTNYTCPNRPYCNYEGIPSGVKVEVLRVVDDQRVDCPKGKPLKRVVIRIKEDRFLWKLYTGYSSVYFRAFLSGFLSAHPE